MSDSIVLLRFPELERRLSLHKNSIYLKLNKNSKFHDPSFPLPVRISANAVGFVESEVNAWLEGKLKERASVGG